METLYKGYTIKIEQDDPMESPREWDNVGTMICFHRNYSLGDKHSYKTMSDAIINLIQDHATKKEKLKLIKDKVKHSKNTYSPTIKQLLGLYHRHDFDGMLEELSEYENFDTSDLPESIFYENLYLYDHSGITMNTTGFSCRWDSGQIGFIYATKQKLEEERIPDFSACLKDEVKTYDQYITGDVYWHSVTDKDGNESFSCGGFYGMESAIDDAKEQVEYELNHTPQQLELNFA